MKITKIETKKIRDKYTYDSIDYADKNLNDGIGINYNHFIKLHSQLIDVDLKEIGEDALYLLWYLLSHAENREYIKTNITLIQSDIKLSKERLNKALKILHKHDLIKIKSFSGSKTIGLNEILEIVIIYDSEYYEVAENKGYKAISIDYIRHAIAKLEPIDFSILLCLIIRFRYYCPDYDTNDDGTIYYTYSEPCCAFPTLYTIGQYLGGKTRKYIKQRILILAEKKFLTYEPNGTEIKHKKNKETGEMETKQPNYKYRIPLLQRIEYMYYNYYIMPDNYNNDMKQMQRKELLKRLKKEGFESVANSSDNTLILDKDYIRYNFNSQMKDFKKYIEEDWNYYSSKLDRQLISNFDNKDIEATSKKKENKGGKKVEKKIEKDADKKENSSKSFIEDIKNITDENTKEKIIKDIWG